MALVGHAPTLAGAAVAAFANNGQAGLFGGVDLNLGLKPHRLLQHLFQCRGVHHPSQRTGRKIHHAVAVAKHPHALDGRDGQAGGPASQRLEQVFAGGVECKRPHVGFGIRLGRAGFNQPHPKAFAGQQKRQAFTHNTAAANQHIQRMCHWAIVGGRAQSSLAFATNPYI